MKILNHALAALLLITAQSLAVDLPRLPTTLPSKAGVVSLATKPLRVLFIGNSYTFYNGGLGTIVQQMSMSVNGGRRIEFVEVTKGGQTLEGHYKEGKALAEIRKGNWDFIVIQEHSMRPVSDREKMWEYARLFDAEVKKVGGKTVFFETWARKNKPEMQTILDQAYTGIAREVKAMVAPAGLAWARVIKSKPEMALHVTDLSHPSPAGTYLNACVFYQTLLGQSCEGLPRIIRSAKGKVLIELSEAEAALLQQCAAETVAAK